eukprot:tig00000430_g649.t1
MLRARTYWVLPPPSDDAAAGAGAGAGGEIDDALKFPTFAAAWSQAQRDRCDKVEIRVLSGLHVFPKRTTLQPTLDSSSRVLFVVRGSSAKVTFRDLELRGSTHLAGGGVTW